MPAPQATLMKQAARLKFASFNLRVPKDWRQPQGEDNDQFKSAFKPDELSTQPATPTPSGPPLFQPASLNRYHTDLQKQMNNDYGEFIDKMCGAICNAWSQWQGLAAMTGIIINAVTASMGQVVGPPWQGLIMVAWADAKPSQKKFQNAVASTLSTAWQSYTATIKVPAMPWYPTFAMFPSPVAPPTPNVPTPVIALTQVKASLTPALMKQQMMAALGDPQAPYAGELFESICDAFDKMFTVWQTSTMVTNVLGTGPIPTFAPPYVPAGPVVGGVGNMPPGGFK